WPWERICSFPRHQGNEVYGPELSADPLGFRLDENTMLPMRAVWVNPNQLDEVMAEVEQLDLAPNNEMHPEAEMDGGLGADPELLGIEAVLNKKVLSTAARTQQFMTAGLGGEQSKVGGQNQGQNGRPSQGDSAGQQTRRYSAAEKGKAKVVDDGKKSAGAVRPRAKSSGISIQEPMSQPPQPAKAAPAVRDSVSSKARTGRAGKSHPLRPKPG
ncbi:unnamed protein product, partial [Linum tenue]